MEASIIVFNLREDNSLWYDDIALIFSRHRGVPKENIPRMMDSIRLREHSGHDCYLIAAVVEGLKIASMLRYVVFPDHVYVNAVHTLEEYRGKGLSKSVFRALFSIVKKKLVLEVEVGNEPAIGLYKALGFGVTKKVKDDQGEYYEMVKEWPFK